MLAFANKVPENILDGLPVVSVTRSGKFIKGVFEGDSEQILKRLEALSPSVIEQMPMNFEETFINEVTRRKEHDKL